MPTAAAFYADPMPADDQLVAKLLEQGRSDPATEAAIDQRASDYINAIRSQSGGIGGAEENRAGTLQYLDALEVGGVGDALQADAVAQHL